MSAVEHSFTDALPERLYLDTDLLVAAIVDVEPHHQRSRLLFERLLREEATILYLSPLCWIEYANVVTREQFRQSLPSEVQQRFRLDRWQHPIVREGYLQFFLQSVGTLLDQFTYDEVALTSEIRTATLQYIAAHALRSYDAVHLATAVSAGVYDFASFDETFRRVDGLHVWNDRIHDSRPA